MSARTIRQPVGSHSEPIYLDFQATTPLDTRVLEVMLPFLDGWVGNAHSTSRHGKIARDAVADARAKVAEIIGARDAEIVFTSGATESNNLLIRGAAESGHLAGRKQIITSTIEHKSVLDIARNLVLTGHATSYVAVDSDGIIKNDDLAAAINDKTALVSIMAANNEIGVVQSIADVSSRAHERDALFHTDAAQAVGKVPIDVHQLGIDLMSISSHKLYGPMGIGAAFIAERVRHCIQPLLHGGGQERGMRSGTLPVPLCVGFGEACRLAACELNEEAQRLTKLRDLFLSQLGSEGASFQLNGSLEKRLPGNLNISFPGVDSEALLMRTRDQISIASGSACTAENFEPSHVILALGLGEERAEEAVRIGFGRTTQEWEVVKAARVIAKAVAGLSRVSYQRVVEG